MIDLLAGDSFSMESDVSSEEIEKIMMIFS